MSDDLDDAVDKVLDSERLIPGENPETDLVEDAEHWLATYAELLGFKDDLVEGAKTRSAKLSPAARDQSRADITVLHAERDRLQRRYDFWQARLAELKAK